MSENTKTKKEIRAEEYALMQRIAAGEEKAFDEFHQKYYHLIYSVVAKVLFSREDCLEVCNDILNTVWRKADVYHPSRGSLVTWICTSARNRAIDRIRSGQRRAALKERFQEAVEVSAPKRQEEPVDHLIREDVKDFVHSAMITLTPEQREVIEMVYYKGMTQKEIAERLESPLGTVKARIRRGMQNLKGNVSSDVLKEGEKLLLTIN